MNRLPLLAGLFLVPIAAPAANVTFVEQLPCLPKEGNAVVGAAAQDLAGGDSLRLYFRRLHPTGAFYFVEMRSAGDGRYWSALPKPEDRRQQPLTDAWWQSLQKRDWLDQIGVSRESPEELGDWLDTQGQEAAEYFVAAYDTAGNRLARSPEVLVVVTEDCDRRLPESPEGLPLERARQVGQARNLTVGETSEMQYGRPVFHWLCDGIVTRVDTLLVMRPDDVCRACVVAWAPIMGAAGAVVAGATIHAREPRRVSEPQP